MNPPQENSTMSKENTENLMSVYHDLRQSLDSEDIHADVDGISNELYDTILCELIKDEDTADDVGLLATFLENDRKGTSLLIHMITNMGADTSDALHGLTSRFIDGL